LNVLVVGGGGREHALAWRLAKSASVSRVFASPGNPGIGEIATCLPAPNGTSGYTDLVRSLNIGLTVVGPEALLVAGIADVFREQQLEIIGPTQAAAQLEGSKIFAKEFFSRAGIPTARSIQTATNEEAQSALRSFSLPVVIKSDGLAAGKGVVVAQTQSEALEAVANLGPKLVIEEFLQGEEVSFIGLSDGRRILPFAPSQDHKRIFDGDQGPNTGGMGAYCDSRILTRSQTDQVMENVMHRAIWQMSHEGIPFTGFLYAGLMMTADGPKVLEFNVRMGDPETQAILHAADGDLLAFLRGDSSALKWTQPSVCVVLAAAGYPEKPEVGDEIKGIPEAEATGATVFQAGTKRMDGSRLVTNGGRVLGVTATGDTLASAIENAYAAVRPIRFEGMQFRQDIGSKGLRRESVHSAG
jgi:phosphoribosylamine---glycine ligase